MAILPTRLQSDLLWESTVPTETYEQFRDHVLTQSARVLDLEKRQGQRRGGVHAIAGGGEALAQPSPTGVSDYEDQEEEGTSPSSSLEEPLVMVNRARINGTQRPDRR